MNRPGKWGRLDSDRRAPTVDLVDGLLAVVNEAESVGIAELSHIARMDVLHEYEAAIAYVLERRTQGRELMQVCVAPVVDQHVDVADLCKEFGPEYRARLIADEDLEAVPLQFAA